MAKLYIIEPVLAHKFFCIVNYIRIEMDASPFLNFFVKWGIIVNPLTPGVHEKVIYT